MAEIQVEFFGIPRNLAGVPRMTASAMTLGEALKCAAEECPKLAELFTADRLPGAHILVSLNAKEFIKDPQHALQDGDHLLLLSAEAGG